MAAFDGLLRETFALCALLILPALCVATLVGTAIAVVQAATQVQEQTLSLLPKLVVVGLFVAFFGVAGMRLCEGLFRAALHAIPALVRGG
jgi:flagellar biosynthetic protein FliQ